MTPEEVFQVSHSFAVTWCLWKACPWSRQSLLLLQSLSYSSSTLKL